MSQTLCKLCGADHQPSGRCPGNLRPTGPEAPGWKITVETPRGFQGFGVLLAPAGNRWLARIRTFPNVLWSVPGGNATLKFLGRSQEEAERKAMRFIRHHCSTRGYRMRDELLAVTNEGRRIEPGEAVHERAQRHARELPVRFGKLRPVIPARTANLSEGGLFIITDNPIAKGESLCMLLALEHGPVPLRGEVVWQRLIPEAGFESGMGVQLLEPPRIYRRYIQALE